MQRRLSSDSARGAGDEDAFVANEFHGKVQGVIIAEEKRYYGTAWEEIV